MKHHRWPKQGVAITPNKTERECLNGEVHWTEFWRGLDRCEGIGTPVCEPALEGVQP